MTTVVLGLAVGTWLLAIGLFGSVLATALLGYEYATGDQSFRRVSQGAAGIATGSFVIALLYLTVQFLSEDYTNAYVWDNTANYLPTLYKVTGVYASNAGSVLLWAMLTAVVVTATLFLDRYSTRGARLSQSLGMGVVTVFAWMLVNDSPFSPLSAEYPSVAANGIPQDGSGLNPLLVDPFMAIHPPITFSAYALMVVPFTVGVTHFVAKLRGRESMFDDWLGSMTRWLRGSWLLLTAAITLGGIWAYRVLGWGGFWSWDPVETSVLIPWLGLTAVLHTLNQYRRSGRYAVLAPAATAALLPLVIYATTVVRSGVFRSVHSFAGGGIGSGVLFLLGTTSTLAVGPAFVHWFRTTESDTDAAGLLDRATIYHAAVLGFILLAFVALWGLTFPVVRSLASGVEVSVDARYYNLWSFPVVVGMLLAGGMYAQQERFSTRATIGTAAAVLVAALVVGVTLARPEWQLASTESFDPVYYRAIGSLSVVTVLPPAVYFATAWVVRYVGRLRRLTGRHAKLNETGIALIHVGAALLIVSVSFVYVFSTTASVGIVGATELDDTGERIVRDVEGSPYTVEVTNYTPENTPTMTEAAMTPAEAGAVDTSSSVILVKGEVTAVQRFEETTIAQLNGSRVWVGADSGTVQFEEGSVIVARGSLSDPRSENIDALVYTNGENVGPASAPPTDVYSPRVVDHRFDVQLYRGDTLVADGTVAEQSYRGRDMQTNDPLIERGITGDTYVVGTRTAGGLSIEISRYPLANQIWFGVAVMLVGMALVFLFDPVSGTTGRRRPGNRE
jgi:cytochrome c-type biogenesis protein CcmF